MFKRIPYQAAIILYLIISALGFFVPLFIIGIPLSFIVDSILGLINYSLSDDIRYILFIALSYFLLALLILWLTKSIKYNTWTRWFFICVCVLCSILTILSALYYFYKINPDVRNQEFGAFKGWGTFFGAWATGFFSGLATLTGGYAYLFKRGYETVNFREVS